MSKFCKAVAVFAGGLATLTALFGAWGPLHWTWLLCLAVTFAVLADLV